MGAGVADYLGTDVTATRVGLGVVAVLGHVAIPAYAAAWALIPEEGKSRSRAAEFLDSVADRVDSAVNRGGRPSSIGPASGWFSWPGRTGATVRSV